MEFVCRHLVDDAAWRELHHMLSGWSTKHTPRARSLTVTFGCPRGWKYKVVRRHLLIESVKHVNFPRLCVSGQPFLRLHCRRGPERWICRKGIVLDLEIPARALPIRYKLFRAPALPFPTATANVAQESPPLVEKHDCQYHRGDYADRDDRDSDHAPVDCISLGQL